jgi:hypothetical protein
MQRRHLTGVERAPKLRCFSFLFRAVNFSALNPFAQRLLNGRQDSIAPFCILPMLLVIVQPKGSIDTDKNEH